MMLRDSFAHAQSNNALLLAGPDFGSALLATLAGATMMMPRSRTRIR
jgi:hypothetical protein